MITFFYPDFFIGIGYCSYFEIIALNLENQLGLMLLQLQVSQGSWRWQVFYVCDHVC